MCKNWIFVSCVLCLTLAVSVYGDGTDPEKDVDKNAGPGSTVVTKSVTVSPTTPKSTAVPSKPPVTTNNSTNCTGTDCKKEPGGALGGIFKKIQENKGMLLRTLYVLIGITSIVILYFVIRAWRLRRRRSKSRKYGLITSRSTDLEMAPLDDDDDDDDDMTVFEHHKLRK